MAVRSPMSPSIDREPGISFARNAAAKNRPRIGILLSSLADGYQAAILQGARETARARGAHLLCFVGGPLGSARPHSAEQNRIYDLVGRKNIDALVIIAGSIPCSRAWPLTVVSTASSPDFLSSPPRLNAPSGSFA